MKRRMLSEDYGKEERKAKKRIVSSYKTDFIHKMNDIDFKSNFAMSRTAFEKLIRPFACDFEKNNAVQRSPIKASTGFLIMIWTLTHRETLKNISSRFGIDHEDIHLIIMKACKLVYNSKKKYVAWTSNSEMHELVEGFSNVESKITGVIGCIGSTHIAINGLSTDKSYINAKSLKSIQIQAVCDVNRMFSNVYVGWPGSALNSIVWKHNPLHKLLSRERPIQKEYHLLGNSSFPLSIFLMTPFRTPADEQKKAFNRNLESIRLFIDEAFKAVKGVFKRMKSLDIGQITDAKYTIMVPFVLYNYILSQGEEISYIEDSNPADIYENASEDVCIEVNDPAAISKRLFLSRRNS